MDAQRALSLVRSKADEWGIDAKRIGMLGFSAGGHLTAWASTNSDKRSYDTIDDVDKVSSRPDFAVLAYPVISSWRRGRTRDRRRASSATIPIPPWRAACHRTGR